MAATGVWLLASQGALTCTALLLFLGGTAAETPSPVEHNIVTEALEADDACDADSGGSGCSVSMLQLRRAATGADSANKAGSNATATAGQHPWWYYQQPHWQPHYHAQPQELTIYMYRAKGAKNFEDTNVNMANLAGVMWYLHNEVVRVCPRKFGIVRVLRYKVTMRTTPELYAAVHSKHSFAHLCHFDSGKCTGPGTSLTDYDRYGYSVGCDRPSTHVAAYKGATWFSLPGACPRLTFSAKSHNPQCSWQDPGGECRHGEQWSRTCTWRKTYAGEVTLQELTGVPAESWWCRQGNYEWKDSCDCGRGTSFWNGKRSTSACYARIEKLKQAFQRKYPTYPADLGEAQCPYGDRNR